jgi:hypothetical protein
LIEHDFPDDVVPGERKALAPLADTHAARVDTYISLYQELVALDGVPSDRALRKTLEQAVPREPGDTPLPFAAKVILAVLSTAVLAFLIPAVLWAVGNVVVPFWQWSTAWL